MPHIPLDLTAINWNDLIKNGPAGRGPFVGMVCQRGGMRGRGIGGILASIISMIPAFLKSAVGKELLSTGENVVSDLLKGAPATATLTHRARQSVKNLTGLGRIKKSVGVLKPHSSLCARRKRSVGSKRSVLLR